MSSSRGIMGSIVRPSRWLAAPGELRPANSVVYPGFSIGAGGFPNRVGCSAHVPGWPWQWLKILVHGASSSVTGSPRRRGSARSTSVGSCGWRCWRRHCRGPPRRIAGSAGDAGAGLERPSPVGWEEQRRDFGHGAPVGSTRPPLYGSSVARRLGAVSRVPDLTPVRLPPVPRTNRTPRRDGRRCRSHGDVGDRATIGERLHARLERRQAWIVLKPLGAERG